MIHPRYRIKLKHSIVAVERMKRIDNEGNYTSLNDQIYFFHSGSYGRLCWNNQVSTITTRFDTLGGGLFIHSVEDRTPSLLKATRIQRFPDSFVFYGNKISICEQIEKAVPLKASFLAQLVKNILETEEK